MGRGHEEKETPRDQRGDKTECPICKVSMHKRSLERHQSNEHGTKVQYLCGICSHKNGRRDNLRAHYRDCHPEKVEEVDQIEAKTLESHERESTSSDRDDRRHTKTPGSKCSREDDNRRKETPKGRDKKVVKATSTPSPERKRKRTGSSRCYSTGGAGGTRNEGEEAKEKLPHKLPKKSDALIPCTLSKAPSEEETVPSVGAVVTHTSPKPLLSKKLEAVDKSGERKESDVEENTPAQQDEAPLEEVAEIALSPTPMTQWEQYEEPTPETINPPSSGTKPPGQREGVEPQVMASDKPTPGEGKERKPPVELRIHHLLAGRPARVTEKGATTVFNGVTQTVHEHRARHYDVIFLKAPLTTTDDDEDLQTTRICRMVREEGGVVSVGPGITNVELEKIASVKKITEKVTRSVFQDGLLITKDHTERVFKTSFVAGVR